MGLEQCFYLFIYFMWYWGSPGRRRERSLVFVDSPVVVNGYYRWWRYCCRWILLVHRSTYNKGATRVVRAAQRFTTVRRPNAQCCWFIALVFLCVPTHLVYTAGIDVFLPLALTCFSRWRCRCLVCPRCPTSTVRRWSHTCWRRAASSPRGTARGISTSSTS